MAGDFDLTTAYNTWTNSAGTAIGGYTYTYPANSFYYTTSYPVYIDKGEKAFNILKSLRKQKLIKIDSVDEFIEAITLIMKEL